MFKKMYSGIKDFIIEEYKFILFLILLYIILNVPLNYYITTGGGISDVSSRIKVQDNYTSKGSFNISFVTELKGNVMTYLLSYIIPSWERDSINDYKYTTSESLEDINFRGELDLTTANGSATYWAYTLAKKEVILDESNLYVITVFNDKYKTPLKIQDKILSMDNNSYDSIYEYKDYLQTKNVGDEVLIKVERKGKIKEIKAKLYESEKRKVLGVGLQYAKTYKTNPKVKINFRRSESGPSGGLITTLEIYNQLTKKDLTKGYKIAGTGTMEPDGTIGEIGGIEHKILGAESKKADYFLSPSKDNYKEAMKTKKKYNLKIKIIEVKTIEDAINKLEELK